MADDYNQISKRIPGGSGMGDTLQIVVACKYNDSTVTIQAQHPYRNDAQWRRLEMNLSTRSLRDLAQTLLAAADFSEMQ